MVYLSRVEIDTKNRRKIKDLTNLGAYHNWIEQSFPDEIQKGVRKRHLWRIDTLANRKYLLVVSEDKPDLTILSRYGVANTAATKEYLPFINSIRNGQRLRFRLVANPVLRMGAGKNGERERTFPHITIDQQKEWLLKRSERAGFKLSENSFEIKERDFVPLYHKENRPIRLSRVAFEGILEVTDPIALQNTLIYGLGREKAYGMGMLTVIPIN